MPSPQHRNLVGAVALATAGLGSLANPAVAQTGLNSVVTGAVGKSVVYDMKITGVTGGDPVEFTPVRTSFTIMPRIVGVVGANPVPPSISVCSSFVDDAHTGGTCFPIARPVVGRTYSGSIMAVASWASLNAKVRIVALANATAPGGEDYGVRQVVADAFYAQSTAATYQVRFDGFELQSTRSPKRDTVWLDMQGMVSSDPKHPSESQEACSVAGFHWCLPAAKYGTVGADGFYSTPNMSISDFRLTPEKEDSLRFYFDLYNAGDSKWAEIARGIGNGFSKVGLIILSAYGSYSGNSGAAGVGTQIDDQIQKLHAAATAECDGPLAVGVVSFRNKSLQGANEYTLDWFTRQTGFHRFAPDQLFLYKDGDYRCDRGGSRYKVQYTLIRTSWRNWQEWPAF